MPSSSELERQYQASRAKRQSITDYRAGTEKELGISNLRQSAQNVRRSIADTEKLLEETPTNVNLRARRVGGPVTAAVLGRLTTQAQQPLAGQLSNFSRSLGVTQQGLSDAERELMNRVNLEAGSRLESDQDYIRRISGAQSREAEARQIALQRQIQAENNRIQEALMRLQMQQQQGGGSQAGSRSGSGPIAIKVDGPTGRTAGLGGELERGIAGAGESVARRLFGNDAINAYIRSGGATPAEQRARTAAAEARSQASQVTNPDRLTASLIKNYGSQGNALIRSYQSRTGLPLNAALTQLRNQGILQQFQR